MASQRKCTQDLTKRARKYIDPSFQLACAVLASPFSQFVGSVAVVLLLFWFCCLLFVCFFLWNMSLSLFEYCRYLLLFFTWQINDNEKVNQSLLKVCRLSHNVVTCDVYRDVSTA